MSVLFLAVSLILVITDCVFFFMPYSDHISSAENALVISDHFEDTHFQGQEDHVIIDASKPETFGFTLDFDIVHPASADFSNNYISSVWQPPQLF